MFYLALFFSAALFASPLPLFKAKNLIHQEDISHEWSEKNVKATVLVFLSSSCPCSNSHVQHLKELSQLYTNVKFIGVHSNADETFEEGRKYFSSKDLPFPVVRDVDSEWANRLKASRTPHAYLIDSKGEILYQGGVSSSSQPDKADDLYLKNVLSDFLSDKKIENSQTRVIGCEITRN